MPPSDSEKLRRSLPPHLSSVLASGTTTAGTLFCSGCLPMTRCPPPPCPSRHREKEARSCSLCCPCSGTGRLGGGGERAGGVAGGAGAGARARAGAGACAGASNPTMAFHSRISIPLCFRAPRMTSCPTWQPPSALARAARWSRGGRGGSWPSWATGWRGCQLASGWACTLMSRWGGTTAGEGDATAFHHARGYARWQAGSL